MMRIVNYSKHAEKNLPLNDSSLPSMDEKEGVLLGRYREEP
jgi:hypothetical protein